MNHAELLEKIDNQFSILEEKIDSEHYEKLRKGFNALRMAVEIHKPFDSGVCGCEIDSITISYTYPCPTIQAIEKELQ
ncbi:hypothetical protein UFOVP655_36 [uncultured Caudovirales phage]|uniref:Uncharacterized protein n=1 Tax=uncultured Caudovirales phage TaxID=2100421 RepID=A0A6J5NBV5_9CAUD|nr:hypothetical protein UFOVP655_36 [uncultured Caudovirales phage]